MKKISVWKRHTKTQINIIRGKIRKSYNNPTFSSCLRIERIIDEHRDDTSVSITPTFVNIMTFLYRR